MSIKDFFQALSLTAEKQLESSFWMSFCFFMMDKLDFDRLLHHWPVLWKAPNTAVLMSCLSGSPFGFNKLINLYLLSSRHGQIKKRMWFPSFTLQPDNLLINSWIEVQRRNSLLLFFFSHSASRFSGWNAFETGNVSMVKYERNYDRDRGWSWGMKRSTKWIKWEDLHQSCRQLYWCNGWKLEVMTPHLSVCQWTSARSSSW